MWWFYFWSIAAMSMTAENLPDGYVVHLPKPKPREHDFTGSEEKIISAAQSESGFEQHERTCLRCKTVRITVIAGPNDAWHEWRLPRGLVQLKWAQPCVGGGEG